MAPVPSTLKGFLAWTAQNATGNRGDDIRALKLAEMQPYEMMHPKRKTPVSVILGLQGAEKCGKRGMKTVRAHLFFDLINLTTFEGNKPIVLSLCTKQGRASMSHWGFRILFSLSF